MTYSIVAHDEETGDLGVAVQSRALAAEVAASRELRHWVALGLGIPEGPDAAAGDWADMPREQRAAVRARVDQMIEELEGGPPARA